MVSEFYDLNLNRKDCYIREYNIYNGESGVNFIEKFNMNVLKKDFVFEC